MLRANETIIFLWLAPLFFQILLPLFILCCYLSGKAVDALTRLFILKPQGTAPLMELKQEQ